MAAVTAVMAVKAVKAGKAGNVAADDIAATVVTVVAAACTVVAEPGPIPRRALDCTAPRSSGTTAPTAIASAEVQVKSSAASTLTAALSAPLAPPV